MSSALAYGGGPAVAPDLAREIVIAGDSHAFAFASNRPGRTEPILVPMPNERATLLSLEGPFPRDLAYWADVVRLSTGRTLAVCFSGNQHNLFLFAPSPMFDFVLASRPGLPVLETARLLPEALVRAFFRPTFTILGGLLAETAGKGQRTFVLGTPPPKADEARIRAFLCREAFFLGLAAERGLSPASAPLTPALVRYKLWCVLQESMAEMARAHGAVFVDIPPETQDEHGFLLPEFWVPDSTHANGAYGKLMLGRLLDRAAAA